MKDADGAHPAWVAVFLDNLRRTGVARIAAQAAGVNRGTPYKYRSRNNQFARDWVEAHKAAQPMQCAAPTVRQRGRGWRAACLEQLTLTSNVQAAADYAGVPVATIYARKQSDPAFALKWRKALFEGYEQLEMEVLAYLRGNLPDRKLDVANAIRQLAAHRRTAAEMRVLEEEEDEQAVLDSIDALIDKMRGSTGPDNPQLPPPAGTCAEPATHG